MNKEFPPPDSRLNGKARLEQVVPTVARDLIRASLGTMPDSIENGTSPPAFRRLKLTHISELLLSTASRYLVKGIIPSVGLVVVWGPPKCGKSFFVFDMVAHIAGNWPYRGRKVKQCPVIYFALEGQDRFIARVKPFRQTHGSTDIPF